jgi:hypothetical protein
MSFHRAVLSIFIFLAVIMIGDCTLQITISARRCDLDNRAVVRDCDCTNAVRERYRMFFRFLRVDITDN